MTAWVTTTATLSATTPIYAPALTIAWRDFRASLLQPATYYFLAGFLAIAGLLFAQRLLAFSDISEVARERSQSNPAVLEGLSLDAAVVAPLLGWLLLLLMVVVPLLTMKTFAGEEREGTLELLLTSPVSPTQLVLGKFFGALGLVIASLALTCWFPIVLLIIAEPDAGPLLAAYAGLLLGAIVFTAVGVFTSALTDSPLLAGFLSFTLLVLSALAGIMGDAFDGPGATTLQRLSVLRHVGPFRSGVLDLGAVAWLLAGTVGLLFVTQRVLESRRWR
jgi:ABC-2 type transport system permease protein